MTQSISWQSVADAWQPAYGQAQAYGQLSIEACLLTVHVFLATSPAGPLLTPYPTRQ
jgi:hypothetical protein